MFKIKKENSIMAFKISTIILLLATIALGVICIKLNFLNKDLKENADYTYNLYVQGITDEEKNMYQEWIDGLGTDELSAYKQGYSEGLSDGQENFDSDLYDDGYSNGYDEAKDEYYNRFIWCLIVILVLNSIVIFSFTNKITKRLERN